MSQPKSNEGSAEAFGYQPDPKTCKCSICDASLTYEEARTHAHVHAMPKQPEHVHQYVIPVEWAHGIYVNPESVWTYCRASAAVDMKVTRLRCACGAEVAR